MFEEKFLRSTVKVRFPKNEYFRDVNFLILFFHSISYNNVVVTKQIYFSPTFLKSWVHISDNIAGVLGLVGDAQYY